MEQSYLDSALAHSGHFGQSRYKATLDFFQKQQEPGVLRNEREEPVHKVALSGELPGSPFPQVTVSLIDRHAIDPCDEGTAVIESVDREVHLGEHVLSDILGVSAVVQDSVKDSKNPGLIELDQLTKSPVRIRSARLMSSVLGGVAASSWRNPKARRDTASNVAVSIVTP
jgi:hypothetical protein